MIERFSWLHVSDLHLKHDCDTWPQNVVLREMIEDIKAHVAPSVTPEFIVVSGDLAYSGLESEYELVASFLDELGGAVSVQRDRIFCVPGNHDIDRRQQKTCYQGARHTLSSQPAVEQFLGDDPERETLLQRQAAYRAFEEGFSAGSERRRTPDGLAYVAPLEIGGLRVCVIGLNSAWACNGGEEDERKTLVGDRQVIEAIEIARGFGPKFVIAAAHHPSDWLRQFDRAAFEDRLLPECDILHRGHLHEPTVKVASTLTGHSCIIAAAGATFATRDFENSYSVLTIDLLESSCELLSRSYVSSSGGFQASDTLSADMTLRGSLPGPQGEIAMAIQRILPAGGGRPHYLAALLCDTQAEIPIVFDNDVVFGPPTLLDDQVDQDARNSAEGFLRAKNLLRAFPEGTSIDQRVAEIKDRIMNYHESLTQLEATHELVREELERRERQSIRLSGGRVPEPNEHTIRLMDELFNERDWRMLKSISERNSSSRDTRVARRAQRLLVISLANGDDPEDLEEAARIAMSLVNEPDATADDAGAAISLLHKLERDDEAKTLVLDAIKRYPSQAHSWREIGRQLATDTGDSGLRRLLEENEAAKEGLG